MEEISLLETKYKVCGVDLMIFDYENKNIQVKLVYYGPAMSGKTTSLKRLFHYFGKENGLKSIDNSVGRTLFFDFGILQFKGTNWGVKFLLYSATGQDFYASTRPATLNGVDGIIFIVDSYKERMNHNLNSWKELVSLFGEKLHCMPLIISFNKQDIQKEMRINIEEFLESIDSKAFTNLAVEKTIALEGDGIKESFQKIINMIFPQIILNYN